jgi:REP element-mobilizing transposase RayT
MLTSNTQFYSLLGYNTPLLAADIVQNGYVSIYVHKSGNVTILVYHLVFPTKYRRLVIDDTVDKMIKDICLEIGKRYEIHFVEIGTDEDHVHFLVQSVPILTVTRIVTIIKSMTARHVLDKIPELKKELWGANL